MLLDLNRISLNVREVFLNVTEVLLFVTEVLLNVTEVFLFVTEVLLKGPPPRYLSDEAALAKSLLGAIRQSHWLVR